MPDARTTRRRRRGRGWSRAHAERLLWRAGFGGRPKEIDFWGRRSKEQAIDWLVRGGSGPHGTKSMVGPAPSIGRRLDPVNEYGHDVLWWLDKMVRTQRPLRERMALLWHDHFATRDEDAPLMLAQNTTFRRHGLGSYRTLLREVTQDPAMQSFLSLADSDKSEPNENFARELMELFTLGVEGGYTETDVREAARALTGFKGNRREGMALTISYDPARHDAGAKRILGRRGRHDWRDTLDLCLAHRAHGPFLVGKLWDVFVTEPLAPATRRRLVRLYTGSGHRLAPVVREILAHKALYADLDDPRMVKWPIVQIAGHLRLVGRGVDSDDWTWIGELMGQQLFAPPSVAGWDWGAAWMSTATMRARFLAATWICKDLPVRVAKGSVDPTWTAAQHVERARRAVGRPWTSALTDRELQRMAQRFLTKDRKPGSDVPPHQAELTQSALRHLLLSGPDAALC